MLGRKTAGTGAVEAIVLNNAAMTQPTVGFAISSTSSNPSSILFGQSDANYGTVAWTYNATPASATFEISTYPGLNTINVTGPVKFWNTTAGAGGAGYFAINANTDVVVGAAAISTSATQGFLFIETCAGTPTGVPTTYTGRAPIVYDTSANKIWFYNGSWRSVAVT